ncbi:MAG: acyl-CoA reductase [Candidatus Binatia bacterium]
MSHISPVDLQHCIAHLLAARERFLVRRLEQDILTSLDRVTARFLDPTSTERQEAETQLSQETGLSSAMVRHILPLIFQEYQSGKLIDLLDDELGAYNRLDRFEPMLSGNRGAFSFPLIAQVLAGNIPGAGLDGMIFSLLVKSATLVKAASFSLVLPLLFARALANVDQELADCLTVVTWPGGSPTLEEIAFSHADIVIASGSDESLTSIRQHVRGRFIGYGHKVSFNVIGKGSLAQSQQLAHDAAYDVALYDQQGCLSPQLIYVEEGGCASPKEFAILLAQELAYWQQKLPRGTIPPDASAAIRRVRNEAEWQALSGKDVSLLASSNGTEWTVIYEADPTFVPSPLYRTIRVKPLTSLTQLFSLLTPWRSYLEAVGVATNRENLSAVAGILGRAGVSRICPIGKLQIPPLSWRHGGRPRVADLVRWVEIE